jgi:adenylate kinase
MKKYISSKKAILIFGPPGSGKSTQATLVAERLGMYHFNTGRILENMVHNPALQHDPEIAREAKNFDEGILITPSFVLKMVKKRVRDLARKDEGVVFSGSPRTYYEAFGDAKAEGLIKTLEDLYGKKNMLFVHLKVSEKASADRNAHRLVCSVCKTPLLGAALSLNLKRCPLCAGELYKRTLDDPKVITVRFKEYHGRTEPIFKQVEAGGFNVANVDGSKLPYQVFSNILKKIHGAFEE